MEELIFPIVLFLVLGLIVGVGLWISRSAEDPQTRWIAAAERFGLYFEARHQGPDGMLLEGELDGLALKVACRLVNARFRQVLADLWLTMPDVVPREIEIRRAISAFAAKRRAGAKNRYEGPRVWKLEGPGAALMTSAIEADQICDRRLTNLFVAYPHAVIENGGLHLDTPGTFGDRLDNTIELARLLAEDLRRVCGRSAR
jgi:hypothetical protein